MTSFLRPSPYSMPTDSSYNSEDEDDSACGHPPPPPSDPATPRELPASGNEDVDMDDIESPDGHRNPFDNWSDDNGRIRLPPITVSAKTGGPRPSLPPVKDLIAEICRGCEQERFRRADWERRHSREHPNHLYAGGDGFIYRQAEPNHDRHDRFSSHDYKPIALDVRRHTVYGPILGHPHPYIPAPTVQSRPRFASHVPRHTPDSRSGPLHSFQDDPYAVAAPLPEIRPPSPSVDFGQYTLSPSLHANPAHAEPNIDPHDMGPGPTYHQRRLSDVRPLPGSWRPHNDSNADGHGNAENPRYAQPQDVSYNNDMPSRRKSEASLPMDPPLARDIKIVVPPAARRQSISGTRKSIKAQPASRSPSFSSSKPVKRRASESTVDIAGPSSARAAPESSNQRQANASAAGSSRDLPFTDEEMYNLGDNFLLMVHPRRKSVQCGWAGGCGARISEPLTANILQHLSKVHNVQLREGDSTPVVCRWGRAGACRRTLKVCSIRNHILNCHEKTKTGTCRMCGSFISRAETYLMNRHLGSCLSKVRRVSSLDEALASKGILVHRDPQTGAASFSTTAAFQMPPKDEDEDDEGDDVDEDFGANNESEPSSANTA